MADEWDAMQRDHEGNYIAHGMFGEQRYTPAHVEELRRKQREHADRAAAATMTRLPFDMARACVKCGQSADDRGRPAKIAHVLHAESYAGPDLGTGEALLRTCRRCGYVWAERPLDAEA